MEVEGIRHVHVHIPPNKGEVCVDGTEIIKALETVVNPKNFPLLIHCNKGKVRMTSSL
jgi:tyrosine-protein phosphatase SIW14